MDNNILDNVSYKFCKKINLHLLDDFHAYTRVSRLYLAYFFSEIISPLNLYLTKVLNIYICLKSRTNLISAHNGSRRKRNSFT